MSRFKQRDERDLERLLAAGTSEGVAAPDDVSAFILGLRAAYPERPVPSAVEAEHLAAMVATARLCGGGGATAEPPDSRAFRGRRRVRMAAKLAAASAAFVLLFCGLALAGTLPGPLQAFAAHAASAFGLDLPRPVRPVAAPPADVEAGPSAAPSPDAESGPSANASPGDGQDRATGRSQGDQQTESQDQGEGQQAQPQTQEEAEEQDPTPSSGQVDEPEPPDAGDQTEPRDQPEVLDQPSPQDPPEYVD